MPTLRRPLLLLALLALALGLAVPAPSSAAAVPYNPTVSAVGAGPTLADATQAALNQIRVNYIILSYTTSNGICSEVPTTGDTICSIKVTARVLRKPGPLPL